MINTVRGRLTLWYMAALALALAAFGAAFYFLASRALYTRVENDLRSLIELSNISLIHDTEEGQSSLSAAFATTDDRKEDEYREAIQMMNEQTHRLSRIVKDMFTLARADAGRYPLDKKTLYLIDLLEEVARAGGLLIASGLAENELVVIGNQGQLKPGQPVTPKETKLSGAKGGH